MTAGYLIDDEETTFLSGKLNYLPSNSSSASSGSSWFPSFGKKKSQWQSARILLTQKQCRLYEGSTSEQDILESNVKAKFLLEMHSKLALSPLKVFTNTRNNSEMYSFALMETDDLRKHGRNSDEAQELLRFGTCNPMQMKFLLVCLESILKSFH